MKICPSLRLTFLYFALSKSQNLSYSELFYVYDLPEAINRQCIAQMSTYNWISDMGFESWPPSRTAFHMNWMFAIEVLFLLPYSISVNLTVSIREQPAVHATLLASDSRTDDPERAAWFYIPFYAGCRSSPTTPLNSHVVQIFLFFVPFSASNMGYS